MKQYSLTVWNDWKYLFGHGGANVSLLRLSFDYLPTAWASISVGLLGFCVTLSWFPQVPVENLGREA